MNLLKPLILIMMLIIIPIVHIFAIQNDYLAIIIILIAILWIVYGWLKRCENGSIKTKKQTGECLIGKEKKHAGIFFGGCFDIWHISHFVLWVLIGLLSPYHYLIAFGLSVGWESYEHIKFKNDGSCTDFLCGRVEDVALNMGGYFLGSYLVTIKSKQQNKLLSYNNIN
jgi:hypothetical protein